MSVSGWPASMICPSTSVFSSRPNVISSIMALCCPVSFLNCDSGGFLRPVARGFDKGWRCKSLLDTVSGSQFGEVIDAESRFRLWHSRAREAGIERREGAEWSRKARSSCCMARARGPQNILDAGQFTFAAAGTVIDEMRENVADHSRDR